MLDFFRTATGSINYVLMGGVFGWFASTWIIAAHIHKHRTEVVSAQKAAEASEEEKKEQERLRIEADRLRVEAENRLQVAEEEIKQLKPKPFPDRLRSFLDRIHSGWDDELRAGTSQFAGELPTFLLTELQNLAAEDKAQRYITIVRQQTIGAGPDGLINEVSLILTPDLLPTE